MSNKNRKKRIKIFTPLTPKSRLPIMVTLLQRPLSSVAGLSVHEVAVVERFNFNSF